MQQKQCYDPPVAEVHRMKIKADMLAAMSADGSTIGGVTEEEWDD